jgi:hypothetical protein
VLPNHLREPRHREKIHDIPRGREYVIPLRGARTCRADGAEGDDVTFVQAAFFVPCFLVAILLLWLLAYVPQNVRQDRTKRPGSLDRMDDLRWRTWSFPEGWPPWTCWPGCRDLHRDDWWTAYLHQTCWSGCSDLHREDWWRAYVDQAGSSVAEAPGHSRPRSTERACGSSEGSALGVGLVA